jgi:hypothetical protein
MTSSPFSALTTDIVLIDIVGFSLLKDEEQFWAVTALTGTLNEIRDLLAPQKSLKLGDVIWSFIPTGDGFYVILNPAFVGYGVFLALSVRSLFLLNIVRKKIAASGIRCAVHNGVAIPFNDINGTRNCIGSGLNDCARFFPGDKDLRATLEGFAGDNNYIAVSPQALAEFTKLYTPASLQAWMSAIGWQQGAALGIIDKHGISHTVYPVEASRKIVIKLPHP